MIAGGVRCFLTLRLSSVMLLAVFWGTGLAAKTGRRDTEGCSGSVEVPLYRPTVSVVYLKPRRNKFYGIVIRAAWRPE